MILERQMGLVEYAPTWQAMRNFTLDRTASTPDEIWICQHKPVYTLGQAGLTSHILMATQIPVVRTDRGGQVTFHGPGQVVMYPLLNLARFGLRVREYVHLLEECLINVLQSNGAPNPQRKVSAPGVYCPWQGGLAKIAALGIKVSRGCAYHGLALNVDMDLQAFEAINPCGYEGLTTIDMKSLNINHDIEHIQRELMTVLLAQLNARLG